MLALYHMQDSLCLLMCQMCSAPQTLARLSTTVWHLTRKHHPGDHVINHKLTLLAYKLQTIAAPDLNLTATWLDTVCIVIQSNRYLKLTMSNG